MRATWPTARKFKPEPGASAGARLQNRSGDNRMNRLSLLFCGRGAPDAPCPAHVAAPGAAGLGRGIFRRGVPSALPAAYGSGPPLRGGDAGWSVRPSECAGGGVFVRAAECFSPGPSAAAALLFPNPFSPRFLPPSSSSLRFLPPALPSFSRCRSGPRDSSGKRCGGEK